MIIGAPGAGIRLVAHRVVRALDWLVRMLEASIRCMAPLSEKRPQKPISTAEQRGQLEKLSAGKQLSGENCILIESFL